MAVLELGGKQSEAVVDFSFAECSRCETADTLCLTLSFDDEERTLHESICRQCLYNAFDTAIIGQFGR